MNCTNCKFWATFTDAVGECRRYPPQLMPDTDGNFESYWPNTHDDDFCGEYAKSAESIVDGTAWLDNCKVGG